ncbi:hypothetical protein EIN_146150 [Entamoeba invadens IP1]|uniref:Rab3-GAP regulatory subunit N-terminal domain-containing protein n=1 Tax=Entamoeba invadens IP1 TaxID=370355 RepID=L7FL85_ENTIV|nr:hypothetical protein EIN_146150 [Entamoeba invadens IP1]ELP87621.1 hypothetical protein EIN_146150 [Entamoeba invadens IP1]|eukprot:XP_004254392.1 hypothetical protein EIN_146150 [Entamoeba invadens IP1]
MTMRVCKTTLTLRCANEHKIIASCSFDNELYLLFDSEPHEVYRVQSQITTDGPQTVSKTCDYSELHDGPLAHTELFCKMECNCKSQFHSIFCFNGDIFILKLLPGKILVVNGFITYSLRADSVDGNGKIYILNDDVFIQATPKTILTTSLTSITEAVYKKTDLHYKEFKFCHEVVALQFLKSTNCFKQNDIDRVLGRKVNERMEMAVYGKGYPVVFKDVSNEEMSTFTSAIPDSRNIEDLCYNPFSDKYVLLSDNFGRLILFDTENRFIVKTLASMRDAQMCWINKTLFLVFSDFRKVMEIHNCFDKERIAFLKFKQSDDVMVFQSGEESVALLVNKKLNFLNFNFN